MLPEIEIGRLESELDEVKAQIEAARLAFAERMIRLGEQGMRLEKRITEAYVKAGLPLPKFGRPSESDHPLIRAVGNLRKWALKVPVPYSTVKKWVYYGVAPSEEWQMKLWREYGVPLSTWPRPVKEAPRKSAKGKRKR